MSEDKLNSIKQQTKLEINKLNKLVNDYKIKEKELAEQYKNKEENFNKNFQEKQAKQNAKLNKREARKVKKIKKKQTKTLSTQTETQKESIQTQTEEDLKPVPQDFTIIKNTINNFLTPNIGVMSTQCNLTEIQEAPKQIIVQKSNNFDIDFYLTNYFRRLNKDNRLIKQILHIDPDTEIKYRRDMLGALDATDDLYEIQITAQFSGDIIIRFYSGQEELFNISYLHRHKSSNQLLVRSKKYKNMNGNNKKVNMKFREFYKIQILTKGDNKYIMKFNGKDVLDFEMNEQIKFFYSNSNFKMLYK